VKIGIHCQVNIGTANENTCVNEMNVLCMR